MGNFLGGSGPESHYNAPTLPAALRGRRLSAADSAYDDANQAVDSRHGVFDKKKNDRSLNVALIRCLRFGVGTVWFSGQFLVRKSAVLCSKSENLASFTFDSNLPCARKKKFQNASVILL